VNPPRCLRGAPNPLPVSGRRVKVGCLSRAALLDPPKPARIPQGRGGAGFWPRRKNQRLGRRERGNSGWRPRAPQGPPPGSLSVFGPWPSFVAHGRCQSGLAIEEGQDPKLKGAVKEKPPGRPGGSPSSGHPSLRGGRAEAKLGAVGFGYFLPTTSTFTVNPSASARFLRCSAIISPWHLFGAQKQSKVMLPRSLRVR
jgi:hypothetical protein